MITARTNTPPSTAITIYSAGVPESSVCGSVCTVVSPLARVLSPGCSEYTVLPRCFFVVPCAMNDVVVRWKIVLLLVVLVLVGGSLILIKLFHMHS